MNVYLKHNKNFIMSYHENIHIELIMQHGYECLRHPKKIIKEIHHAPTQIDKATQTFSLSLAFAFIQTLLTSICLEIRVLFILFLLKYENYASQNDGYKSKYLVQSNEPINRSTHSYSMTVMLRSNAHRGPS